MNKRWLLSLSTFLGLIGALVLADLAAFELASLLPDVGGRTNLRTAQLFRIGAVGLVGAQTLIASLVVISSTRQKITPILLGLPPAIGLGLYMLLGPGRLALSCFAIGLGVCWLGVGRRLRSVSDVDVPTGPDPWT